MDKKKNYAQLKKKSQELGLDLFGSAKIESIKKEFTVSPQVLGKVDKAISLGIRLSGLILEELQSAPTRMYFHHYRTANTFLDQAALRLSNYIQLKGYCALPIAASQIVDWQKQTAHLSHKKIAYLAGLGWIGSNNLLVNKAFGSQIRLVSILTDFPLSLDKPVTESCGDCFICLKVCPASAIKESPEQFEPIKCFEKLKEFQKQRLVDQFICGVCLNACKGKKRKNKKEATDVF